MASAGDVVELADGSVGVLSETVPSPRGVSWWRAWFPDFSTLVIAETDISSTLSAPTYSAGDSVEVWPYIGAVKSVDGSEVTVTLERSLRIEGVGHIQWEPDVTVPFWQVVLHNDTRLKREW